VRRWCRASAFPSHAGHHRSTGPPTETHEDLFTGNAAHVDAEKRLQAETGAELDALFKPAWDIIRKDKGRRGKAEG